MATIAVFFLLLTLTSTAIHARESQLFAKVSNTPKETLPNLNNNNNNPQNTNQQQQPTFVPQSQDSGFGLYGHESGQLPPSDTTTITTSRLPANLPENYNPVAYTTPIHSNTQGLPNEYNEPQAYNGESKLYSSENQQEFVGTNNGENTYNSQKQEVGNNMYNSQNFDDTRNNYDGRYHYAPENAYNSKKFDDTRFTETENNYDGRYHYAPENAYNSKNFDDTKFMETENNNGGNTYNIPQNQGMVGEAKYVAANNGQQGMSDTRFLENGKYYHDVNSERMNAAANNANMNSRGVRNGFETQGYYGENQNPQGYYDNSQNSYDRYNTNGGYQNQEFDP